LTPARFTVPSQQRSSTHTISNYTLTGDPTHR
jgi:hypothetical protein